MISFAVTALLICAFAFAYASCWFSHGMAHQLYESHVSVSASCFPIVLGSKLSKEFWVLQV